MTDSRAYKICKIFEKFSKNSYMCVRCAADDYMNMYLRNVRAERMKDTHEHV